MQSLFLALLLAAVFSLLVPGIQRRLQTTLSAQPGLVWLVPVLLAAIFAAASLVAAAFSAALTALILVYALAPVACVFHLGRAGKVPHALDFLAILLLWLPLEFAAGQSLVPRQGEGVLRRGGY